MKSRLSMFALLLWMAAQAASAQELKPIDLPKPQTDGGRPFMQVLKDRKSVREFSPAKLSDQHLANLLWAAFGINRPDGHRTAPSAMNAQEMDVYVATTEGLYLYDARAQQLKPVLAGDLRARINGQDYVKVAPVTLVYVADFARMTKARAEEKDFYSAADTGFISQNVYLYCASEGLATVVFGLGDRDRVAQVMKLRPDQKPVLGEAVGLPKP